MSAGIQLILLHILIFADIWVRTFYFIKYFSGRCAFLYIYFSTSISNLKSHSKQTLKYKTQQARWHKHLGPRQIFEISIQRRSDSEFHAKWEPSCAVFSRGPEGSMNQAYSIEIFVPIIEYTLNFFPNHLPWSRANKIMA